MQAATKDPLRQRITQQELNLICTRHDRLWQARPGGARAVFAWMDMSGLDLSGRNLTDADFSAADMSGCDLTGAKLDNATFFGTDLQGATLIDASLRRADLRGACLRGADLSGADLFEADLREGTLATADARTGFRVVEPKNRDQTQAQGACLAGANLQRSRLSGIIAQAADFSDAIMKDCKLVRANLKQANFRGADLAGADLSGADLTGADLRDAVLVGVTATMWRTDGANLNGALTDKGSAGAPVADLPAADMLHEHAVWCESVALQVLRVDACCLRGGGFAFDQRGFASADLDAAGLEGLGQFALKADGQQAVVELGIFDHDVVSQLEAALEIALGKATVQIGLLRRGVVVRGLAARHGQQVFLDLDVEFFGLEAGHGDLDAVGVFRRRLDVIGRPAIGL